MARGQSQGGSRNLSASARSELSNAPKNAPKNASLWKDIENTIGELANDDAVRYQNALDKVNDSGNRFELQDANQTYDRQNAYSDKGFELARSIGEFISITKDTEKYPQVTVGGGSDTRTAFDGFKDLKIIDNLMDNSWNKVSRKAFAETKDSIARAYRRDVGEDATDQEVKDIFEKEIEPRLLKVKEFVDKSIDDSVYKDKYSPTRLYEEAKRLHRSEVYNTSLENNYNRSIMDIVNSQADKYIKQIKKDISKL
jgi:hypothetical protein